MSERCTFPHGLVVQPITFSRDGKVLATAGADAPVFLWDVYGRRTRAKPDAAMLDRAWAELASPNAATGFDGVRTLIAAPTETVHLLRSRLPVAIGPDAATLRQWLTDLDSPAFATREKATKELTAVAGQMEPVLRKALAAAPSLEVQRRLEAILAHAGKPTPAVLRAVRAVEVLEVIGTPESKRLLADLAGGSANQRLTIEAKAAVGRQK